MNPHPESRLSDEAVSSLPIESGRAELLEQILATDTVGGAVSDRVTRLHRRRWVAPLAAAAAVVAIAGTSVWWASGSSEPVGSPAAGPTAAGRSGAADPSPSTAPSTGRSATTVPVASDPNGYRAVLTAPGWTVSSTEDEPPYGEIDYENGDARFEITWYGASSYASYVKDREDIVSPPAPGDPVQVLGRNGQLWAYGPDDHTVIREVHAGHWMEIRGSGMSLADYRALLDQLSVVDRDHFEATLPGEFVSTSDRSLAIMQILAGIDRAMGPARGAFPTGQDPDLKSGQSDPYQLGAYVAGQVACSWLSQYATASAEGDQGAAQDAVAAMATSRQWPVLKQMDAQGDYPEVVWQYADQIAAGQSPDGYQQALGC